MSFDSVDNIQRILGIKPMSMSELINDETVSQSKPAPKKLGKSELEQMLSLLDYSKFAEIDSKCRQNDYLWGKQPLLKYTPEALAKYASIIYHSILPHFDTMTITEEEYVAKWTAPYTDLQAQLALKADGFISTLSDIAANPIINSNKKIIAEPEYDLYTQISNFLKGNNDFYENLNDFLFNTLSPLRKDDVTDSRVIALITEVNSLRAKYNKKLEAFVVKHSDCTEKTEEIHNSSENKKKEIVYLEKDVTKLSYKLPADKTTYGTELKHYRDLIQERLDYYVKLTPKRIVTLTAHKAQIPQADWDLIAQAIETKIVSKAVGTLITATIKAIKANATPVVTSSATEPVDTYAVNEAFISGFMLQLENTYAIPVIKNPEELTAQELLDDVYTTIDALYTANTQDSSLNAVQDQQKSSEEWYSDYNNLSQSLKVYLQIVLNKVSPNVVLSDEVLNHGAIKGMLSFAKQVRNPDIHAYDYEKLAQELRQQLKAQTNSYTLIAPLPQLVPMTKEQLEQSLESTVQQDTSFNITKYIQPKLNKLRPTTALTECEELPLSAKEVAELLPIPDHTITELVSLSCGTGTKPYLLKGNLIAYTKHNKYLKIVPHINEDDYAVYTFSAINYKALNYRIDKYCELLHAIPAYDDLIGYHRDEDDEFFGIAPEYDYDAPTAPVTAETVAKLIDIFTDESVEIDNAMNEYALSIINSLLKSRMQSSNEHLSLVSIPDCQKSQSRLYDEDLRLQECLKTVVKRVYDDFNLSYKSPYAQYYDPTYYISGHHLSMWMADPKDYTEKITFGNGDYSVDHILQGVEHRSNNSFENIRIKTVKFNSGRTSRSIPVTYNGDEYNSISDYCTITEAGNADNITDLKNSLNLGETKIYKGRAYTLSEDTKQLIATDAVVKTTQITYNGTSYSTLKDFAKGVNLDYKSLHNALSNARKKGKTKFKFKKKYTIYLDEAGDITKVV